MKAKLRRVFVAPFIILFFSLLAVVGFQNCTNDASFDSDPSATGDGGPAAGLGVNDQSGEVVIQINEFPQDSNDDSGAVVDFEVTSPNGPVTDVTCELNGQDIDCDPTDRVTLPPTGTGEQTFTITATNGDGVTSTEQITWTVYDTIAPRSKQFAVTTVGDAVDIIINIDNSGSMKYEQESMAGRIANFMAPFAGLRYNIAITTTSPVGAQNNGVYVWAPTLDYVDGKFTELDGNGTFCIKSSTHSNLEAQQLISENVVRSTNLLDSLGNVLEDNKGNTYPEGNGWERGIYTTRRAFERDVAGTQNDNSCIRGGQVPKHVILISDEDETIYHEDENSNPIIYSGETGPRELPDQGKSKGAWLRAYIATEYGANTVFKFHSIIVDPFTPEGANCLAGHGRSLGIAYGVLSQRTGGYIGSVCAADYSTQLGEIGQIISDSSLTEALGCVAVQDDGTNGNAGSYGVVTDDSTGLEIATAYTFAGDKVEFGNLLGRGNYTINYYCFQ